LAVTDDGLIVMIFTQWVIEFGFWGYITHIYFPVSGAHVLVNLAHTISEKNWAFVEGRSTAMRTTSAIDPLEVVQCSGRTGDCRYITGNRVKNVGELRPGSQRIRLPFGLSDGTELFAGVPRVHFRQYVGPSGAIFYHPSLMVIGKKQDEYRILAMSGCVPVEVTLRNWKADSARINLHWPVVIVIPWSIL
jgi:hypothetical protein